MFIGFSSPGHIAAAYFHLCQVCKPICSVMVPALAGQHGWIQSSSMLHGSSCCSVSWPNSWRHAGDASDIIPSPQTCAIGLCRSKVGVAFENKDEARKVRSGKYSLVDLDSFSSPPVSPGATKPKPKPKYAPAVPFHWPLCYLVLAGVCM